LGVAAVRGDTDDLYNLDAFIRSRLREGVVFVDVGANVGYYTLVVSKLVGAVDRVYAIEPSSSTAAGLRVNVKLNRCGNVMLKTPASMYGYASAVREGASVIVNASALRALRYFAGRGFDLSHQNRC